MANICYSSYLIKTPQKNTHIVPGLSASQCIEPEIPGPIIIVEMTIELNVNNPSRDRLVTFSSMVISTLSRLFGVAPRLLLWLPLFLPAFVPSVLVVFAILLT